MPAHLKRFQGNGDQHFITFSCHERLPYFRNPGAYELFVAALAKTQKNCQFGVFGYVVMPEHVHLLMMEPNVETLASAIQALKVSVSKRSKQRPFWLPRYYDENVRSRDQRIDILKYIHRNPVKRGLVDKPEDWLWSSFRHYFLYEPSLVEITPP